MQLGMQKNVIRNDTWYIHTVHPKAMEMHKPEAPRTSCYYCSHAAYTLMFERNRNLLYIRESVDSLCRDGADTPINKP